MLRNILSLAFLCSMLSFMACNNNGGSDDVLLQSIPQEVSMVTAFDTDAILEKADFASVRQMEFYRELVNSTKQFNATLGDILADPAASGINVDANIYMAHHFDPDNPEEVFIGILAGVQDKSKLEALIQSNSKYKINSQKNFELAMSGSQSVAWNDDKILLGMTNSYADPLPKIECFFMDNSEGSIAADPNLGKAIDGSHDISSWFTSNVFAKSPMLKNILLLAGIKAEAIKDNYIHSYVDFKDGEMESRSDLFLQDALLEDVNLFFKDRLTTDFSSMIPADANGVMTVSLDLEGVQQVLSKRPQASMMLDFVLKEYGLSVGGIAKTFGGDILLYSSESGDLSAPGSFATTIKNKDELNRFLQVAMDYKVIEQMDDQSYRINSNNFMAGANRFGQAQLLVLDDMIFISSDADAIAAVRSGGFKGDQLMDDDQTDRLQDNILTGFIDYKALLRSISRNKDIDINMENATFTTNRKSATFDISFEDNNVNSLKQLMMSINEFYLANKDGGIIQ